MDVILILHFHRREGHDDSRSAFAGYYVEFPAKAIDPFFEPGKAEARRPYLRRIKTLASVADFDADGAAV
jgi:hypothetical protein